MWLLFQLNDDVPWLFARLMVAFSAKPEFVFAGHAFLNVELQRVKQSFYFQFQSISIFLERWFGAGRVIKWGLFGTTKRSAFFTNALSRFVSVILIAFLGPPRLALHNGVLH